MATYVPVLPLASIEDDSDPIDIEQDEVHNFVFSGTGSIGIYAMCGSKPELLNLFSPEEKSGRLLGPIKYKAIRHSIGKISAIGYFV